MSHTIHDVGIARQIGRYSDAIESAAGLRWLHTSGTPGLSLTGELGPGGVRVEHEIALFADRVDVTEELTRVKSHLDQAASLLASPEPAGRRLDFLLQEMTREMNTIGAKSPDAAISHAVVEIKAEIERMREQVQNVE